MPQKNNWIDRYEEEFGWSENYWLDDKQIEFISKEIKNAYENR